MNVTATEPESGSAPHRPAFAAFRWLDALDRSLAHSKSIFFVIGLLLLFAGWMSGTAAVATQHSAILKGLTACGSLIAGSIVLAASAVAPHRLPSESAARSQSTPVG